jgi:hypothetical protein
VWWRGSEISPELVRSKNAGPFWHTIEIFFSNDEDYHAVAETLNPGRSA